MVKKYRLIKEYPGSPKLNSQGWNLTNHSSESFIKIGNKTSNNNLRINFENYPEYWENIIEKGYQILSLYSTKFDMIIKGDVWKLYTEEKYVNIITKEIAHLDDLLQLGNHWSIYSVKRLSDGEIFTIGDRIHYSDKYPDFNIEKIEMNTKDMNRIEFFGDNYFCTFIECKISKVKSPLFTTEDGVDVFEKTSIIYAVKNDSFILTDIHAYVWGKQLFHEKLYKIFSTKKAAEKYIIMNKPCLSINDITTIFKTYQGGCDIKNHFAQELKKLVKLTI